jgi:hypothetical protein
MTADNYDTGADSSDVNAQKLFATILADYDLISAGRADASDVFWNDVTQFITFATRSAPRPRKPTLRPCKKNGRRCLNERLRRGFLRDARRHQRHPVALMPAQSFAFRRACKKLVVKHIRTRPIRPKPTARPSVSSKHPCVNGPMLVPTTPSNERTAELPRWLHRYNWHRPHGGIKSQTPISRLGITGNNLLRPHT